MEGKCADVLHPWHMTNLEKCAPKYFLLNVKKGLTNLRKHTQKKKNDNKNVI